MKGQREKIHEFVVTCTVNGVPVREEDMNNYKVSNPVLNGILNAINRGEIEIKGFNAGKLKEDSKEY